jgi:hypothetical protein
MSAIRNKQTGRAIIANGNTVSSAVQFGNFAWMALEVPAGDAAVAVTVEVRSGDSVSWIEAFTIDDVTNRIKPLASEELAVIGPFSEFR